MADQKEQTEDIVLVDFDTIEGSPDGDKVIASDSNDSAESKESGQSGADKPASGDQSAEQSTEQKLAADGSAASTEAKKDGESTEESPELKSLRSQFTKSQNANIGQARENRELRRDMAELKGMLETKVVVEDSPLDKWLSEHGDDKTTMDEVPIAVRRQEDRHQEAQRQASQDTRDQKRATDDASSQVTSRIAEVMADPEAKILLDMANSLMDDDQARIVSEAILTAGDATQARDKARSIARIVIEELGTDSHRTMLKALGVTTSKTDSKAKSGQSEEQPKIEPAETEADVDMEFSAFEGLLEDPKPVRS